MTHFLDDFLVKFAEFKMHVNMQHNWAGLQNHVHFVISMQL